MSSDTRRRCAIYTRKSSEEGLEQEFNSLHAQREACEAFVRSQQGEGWQLVRTVYDDGGFSGCNLQRPALSSLLNDIRSGLIDVVVVYKVDRLSRSLADFMRLVELFDQHNVSFVSVTQQFNTSTSMGRLTLNVLLSFAQFEREVTGERIRDKIAASKRKGLWMGGRVPFGYRVDDKRLIVDEAEAAGVRALFRQYLKLASVRKLKAELDVSGVPSTTTDSKAPSRHPRTRGALYNFLSNPLYIGKVRHKGQVYDGQHAPIIDRELWDNVQAQLGHNRQQRDRQSNARHPSLLAGLIFDDRGHAMSPSHANKGTRRYRYYTSQALLLYKGDEAGSVVRVPARDVETAVVNELRHRLEAPLRLLETQDTTGWPVQKIDQFVRSGKKLTHEWDEQSVSDQIDCLRCLIRRVVVSRESIEITFAAEGWVSVLLPDDTSVSGRDLADVTAKLPAKLRRSAHESRLVIKDADVQQTPAAWREALQSAIAKAMGWNAELVNGEVASVRAIAERENVSERYVARILRLAWLAPDIVRKVAQGDVPDTLTLRRLQQGYPLDWAQQQSALLAQ